MLTGALRQKGFPGQTGIGSAPCLTSLLIVHTGCGHMAESPTVRKLFSTKLFNLLSQVTHNEVAALKCGQRKKLITKFLQLSYNSALCKNAVLYFKPNVLDTPMYQTTGRALGLSQPMGLSHCSEVLCGREEDEREHMWLSSEQRHGLRQQAEQRDSPWLGVRARGFPHLG